MSNPLTQHKNITRQLEIKILKINSKFQMASELKVKRLHYGSSKRSGEVIGKTIHIYEVNEAKALDTLRHEFIDYILTKEFVSLPQKLIKTDLII